MIEQFMTKRIVTVEMDDSLSMVKDIFEHTKFHHILVVENGDLAGVVSDRDLFKAISFNIGTVRETDRDKATLNKKVHQVMSREAIFLRPEDSIDKALEYFNTYRISCIPILDAEDKIVGILSWRDLLTAIKSCDFKYPTN